MPLPWGALLARTGLAAGSPHTPECGWSDANVPLLRGNSAQRAPWWGQAAGDGAEAVQSLPRVGGAKRRLFGPLGGADDAQSAGQPGGPPPPAGKSSGADAAQLVATGAALLTLLVLSAIGSQQSSGLAGGAGGRHSSRRFLLVGGQQGGPGLASGHPGAADAPANEPAAARHAEQDAVWNVTLLLATSGAQAAEMAVAEAAQQAFLASVLPAVSEAAGSAVLAAVVQRVQAGGAHGDIAVSLLLPKHASRRLAAALAADPLLLAAEGGGGGAAAPLRASRVECAAASCGGGGAVDPRVRVLLGCWPSAASFS